MHLSLLDVHHPDKLHFLYSWVLYDLSNLYSMPNDMQNLPRCGHVSNLSAQNGLVGRCLLLLRSRTPAKPVYPGLPNVLCELHELLLDCGVLRLCESHVPTQLCFKQVRLRGYLWRRLPQYSCLRPSSRGAK